MSQPDDEAAQCPETDVILAERDRYIARACSGKRGHSGPHMLGPIKVPTLDAAEGPLRRFGSGCVPFKEKDNG